MMSLLKLPNGVAQSHRPSQSIGPGHGGSQSVVHKSTHSRLSTAGSQSLDQESITKTNELVL